MVEALERTLDSELRKFDMAFTNGSEPIDLLFIISYAKRPIGRSCGIVFSIFRFKEDKSGGTGPKSNEIVYPNTIAGLERARADALTAAKESYSLPKMNVVEENPSLKKGMDLNVIYRVF